jgi:hypothetical protein
MATTKTALTMAAMNVTIDEEIKLFDAEKACSLLSKIYLRFQFIILVEEQTSNF